MAKLLAPGSAWLKHRVVCWHGVERKCISPIVLSLPQAWAVSKWWQHLGQPMGYVGWLWVAVSSFRDGDFQTSLREFAWFCLPVLLKQSTKVPVCPLLLSPGLWKLGRIHEERNMVSLTCEVLLSDKEHGITANAHDLKNVSNTQLLFDLPQCVIFE